MQEKIPPKVQQKLLEVDQSRRQLQSVIAQRESFKTQMIELDSALDELESLKKGEEIYKSVGPVLVKSERDELRSELQSKRRLIKSRLKRIKKQEKRLRRKFEKSQKELQKLASGLEEAS